LLHTFFRYGGNKDVALYCIVLYWQCCNFDVLTAFDTPWIRRCYTLSSSGECYTLS